MNSARRQKKASPKDLRDINRILKKLRERENKVVFSRVAQKGDLCVIGVSDASYNQEDHSVAGELLMLGNKRDKKVLLMF